MGFRICFDVRFPESFRALYRRADLCFVSFSDAKPDPDPARFRTIQSHLITRAVENLLPLMTVNTLSASPTAPVAFFDQYGQPLAELDPGQEGLLVWDFQKPEETFGSRGIRANRDYFLGLGD